MQRKQKIASELEVIARDVIAQPLDVWDGEIIEVRELLLKYAREPLHGRPLLER